MSKPIFILAAFHAWCKTKDPAERFSYVDVENCALAQYHRHIGAEYTPVAACGDLLLRDDLSKAEYLAVDSDRTFGGLTRALESHLK